MRRAGNTSTDVEKTSGRDHGTEPEWKHLHGRGEDYKRNFDGSQLWRNTSTDVEKTPVRVFAVFTAWKHLHGRGEDMSARLLLRLDWETPPRTWRRPVNCKTERPSTGNTSTDVEKTTVGAIRGFDSRNTSTDVEKTCPPGSCSGSIGKHLHGRGEDTLLSSKTSHHLETPPRTWRRLYVTAQAVDFDGNTSTDVEKTARFSVRLIQPTLLFVVVVDKGGSLTN